jgi:hypothetical protein
MPVQHSYKTEKEEEQIRHGNEVMKSRLRGNLALYTIAHKVEKVGPKSVSR